MSYSYSNHLGASLDLAYRFLTTSERVTYMGAEQRIAKALGETQATIAEQDLDMVTQLIVDGGDPLETIENYHESRREAEREASELGLNSDLDVFEDALAWYRTTGDIMDIRRSLQPDS